MLAASWGAGGQPRLQLILVIFSHGKPDPLVGWSLRGYQKSGPGPVLVLLEGDGGPPNCCISPSAVGGVNRAKEGEKQRKGFTLFLTLRLEGHVGGTKDGLARDTAKRRWGV